MLFFKKYWRLIFPVVLTLILVIAVFVFKPEFVPAGFFAAPSPKQAPTREPVEAIEPEPEAIEGAVAILADGEPVCVVNSADVAEELLSRRLNNADLPEGEAALYAEFTRYMELRSALPHEQPVSIEEAEAILASGRCPVRVVTRTFVRTGAAYSTDSANDKRLAKGSRIVLQAGRDGEEVTIEEYAYVDGVRSDVPVKNEMLVMPAIDESIIAGTYTSKKSEPATDDGEKGPARKDFSLKAPCPGKITKSFGLYGGKMSNGVDYSCKVGDKIIAPASGTVIFARERESYGFIVEIDHGEGFVTRLSPIKECELRVGDTVEKGDSIGVLSAPVYEDETPRLHMELLIGGIPYNPRQYLK